MGQGRFINLVHSLRQPLCGTVAPLLQGVAAGAVQRALQKAVQRVTSSAADLLFPPSCLACDRELEPPADAICVDCQSSFGYPGTGVCPICAAPVAQLGGQQASCVYCQRRKYEFNSTVALGIYAGRLRDIVLRCKHSGHESLARAMGQLLARQLESRTITSSIDAVVPIPMHWWRRLKRGIPAAESVAEGLAAELGSTIHANLLLNRRRTLKQGTLSMSERFQNVAQAFCLNPRYDIAGARILIVDDVMTTGATANAAARLLGEHNARTVQIAVLARGTGR